jgi:hypothetical protein
VFAADVGVKLSADAFLLADLFVNATGTTPVRLTV